MEEKISIIIGIRNRYDQRIKNALKSIRNQTYDKDLIEVVLVDYGSDEQYQKEFDRLCKIYNVKGIWTNTKDIWNKSCSLNIGIRNSKNDYILLSDVDIIFQKNYIQECINEIKENPNQALYCSLLDLIDSEVTSEIDVNKNYSVLKSKATSRASATGAIFPYGISQIFLEKQKAIDIGGYDEYYQLWGEEDIDFAERLEMTGIKLKNISAKTSHLHQWHKKYEGVANLAGFREIAKDNKKHFLNNSSIVRNISPQLPKKLPGSFWGITTFFNPMGYKNRYENYKIFREKSQKQGLKLLAVELAFVGNPFELKKGDADILIQLRIDNHNVLWQKEAMLNIGLKNLPKDCDKIVWLDCDIIFEREDWISDTVKLLERYVIVQPFSYCVRLPEESHSIENAENLPIDDKDGCRFFGRVYYIVKKIRNYVFDGHTGFAWAARREIFDKSGFYDGCIIGGGDTFMSRGFYGEKKIYKFDIISKDLLEPYRKWVTRISSDIKFSIYYAEGYIFHLWHGKISDRRYLERHLILKDHNFNPEIDIKKNKDGLWEWASNKPKMHNDLKMYFFQRNENKSFITSLYSIFYDIIGIKRFFRNAYHRFAGFCGIILEKISPDFYFKIKNIFSGK